MKILIVEDDPKITSFLKQGLTEEYFCVDVCDNGEDALYLAQHNVYEVILLDIMIKGLQGDTLCLTLRTQNILTPIIVLSAKSTISDKVSLLNMGADDYLTKPFSFDELIARIHVQLRQKDTKTSLLTLADLELNPLSKEVTRAKTPILLTAKEYILLEYLLRSKNTIVSEAILLEQLFTMEQSIQSNILNVYMYRLRAKIDKNYPLKLIKTHRNQGYSLSDAVL